MGADDHPEFWFRLYGISALVAVPLAVTSIGKLTNICDKRAKMCGHPLAFMPSILSMTLAALVWLGLMIPATFIHVDEDKPDKDGLYDAVNWIVYIVMMLMFFWPHVYTADYYSSRRWKKYVYSSYRYVVGIANFLYWTILAAATVLMIVVDVMTGIDGRYTSMGIYIAITLLLSVATMYFTMEWYFCSSEFKKQNEYYGGSKTVVEIIMVMERNATQEERRGITVTHSREMYSYPQYGYPERKGY